MSALTRREFSVTAAAAAVSLAAPAIVQAQTPPHVLYIAVDDLNDWNSAQGGYPEYKANGQPLRADGKRLTPNMLRLAARSAVMLRGMTISPYCSTARNCNQFGLYPWRTGVYAQGEDWYKGSQVTSGQKMIWEFFRAAGYYAVGTGKITHSGWRFNDKAGVQARRGVWDEYQQCNSAAAGCNVTDELFSGGILAGGVGPAKDQNPDSIRAKWMVDNVIKTGRGGGKPIFAGLGLHTPHLRWVPPAEMLALFDPADIVYPPGVMYEDRRSDVEYATAKDLRDEPSSAIRMAKSFGEDELEQIIHKGTWLTYVRQYLAEIATLDYSLGLVLDALDDPASVMNWSNTIVCLWSDNGWQLGEKLAWHKFSLWERATRIPFMFAGPGVTAGVCPTPIGTIDMFPTLCDMALGSVPTKADLGKFALDGVSRKDWMSSPTAPRTNRVVQCWARDYGETDSIIPNPQKAHFSVVTNEWGMGAGTSKSTRFIQYDGGDRAFYGPDDEWEHHNLYDQPSAEIVARADSLTAYLPNKATMAPRAGLDAGSDAD